MSNDLIKSAPRQTFVFGGRFKEYEFEFVMLSGRPWVPINEIERVLYREDSDRGDCTTGLSHNGRALEMYAAVHLDPSHRFVDSSGNTWLSVNGATQVLAKREEQACIAFREQLGDWLERQVIDAYNAMNQQSRAIEESSSAMIGGLGALKAIVAELERHESVIKASAAASSAAMDRAGVAMDQSSTAIKQSAVSLEVSNNALAIAKSTRQCQESMYEIGFSIASDFLLRFAPDIATSDNSKEFGAFMARQARERGGIRSADGWSLPSGRKISKVVPAPGTMYATLNKWSDEWMSRCLPKFRGIVRG